RACDFPMPLAPPVISATLPSSRPIVTSQVPRAMLTKRLFGQRLTANRAAGPAPYAGFMLPSLPRSRLRSHRVAGSQGSANLIGECHSDQQFFADRPSLAWLHQEPALQPAAALHQQLQARARRPFAVLQVIGPGGDSDLAVAPQACWLADARNAVLELA